MIARVADHCFWLGRYLERAESTARLLQVTSSLALDADLTSLQCWQPVLITTGEEPNFIKAFGAEAMADGEQVQRYLTFRRETFCAVKVSVAAARENARSIREVISLEAWEAINELHLWLVSDMAEADFVEQRYNFYRRVRREVQLCQGILRGTMLVDTPLDFIWLGTLIERLGQTARILDVHHHAFRNATAGTGEAAQQVVETALWLSLLRACYGFEPFTKSHRGVVTGDAVATFLVFEKRFPRSVRHCLTSANQRLASIRPRERSDLPGMRALERLGSLELWLNDQMQSPLTSDSVHALLTHVVDETDLVCSEISEELLAAPLVPLPKPSAPAPVSQSQSQS